MMKRAVAPLTAVLLAVAFTSLADQQQVYQSMEKGKAAFEEACTACHDAAQAASADGDRAAWAAVVDDMMGKGAKVGEDAKDPLTGYLAAGSLLRKKCSVCHSPQRPLSKNKDLAGWEKTVTRMSGKRPGHLSEQDIEEIVGYLAAERPLP